MILLRGRKEREEKYQCDFDSVFLCMDLAYSFRHMLERKLY